MTYCDQHSGNCKDLEHNQTQIQELWEVMRTRMAAKTFFWAMGVVAMILAGMVGYLNGSYVHRMSLDKSVTVIQTRMEDMQKTLNRIDRAINHYDRRNKDDG